MQRIDLLFGVSKMIRLEFHVILTCRHPPVGDHVLSCFVHFSHGLHLYFIRKNRDNECCLIPWCLIMCRVSELLYLYDYHQRCSNHEFMWGAGLIASCWFVSRFIIVVIYIYTSKYVIWGGCKPTYNQGGRLVSIILHGMFIVSLSYRCRNWVTVLP